MGSQSGGVTCQVGGVGGSYLREVACCTELNINIELQTTMNCFWSFDPGAF